MTVEIWLAVSVTLNACLLIAVLTRIVRLNRQQDEIAVLSVEKRRAESIVMDHVKRND